MGKCEVGAKRSKAGSASWHKDDMPLMKLRLCHTCEEKPRSELTGFVDKDGSMVRVHIKAITGVRHTQLTERLKAHVEANGCSKRAALEWFESNQ